MTDETQDPDAAEGVDADEPATVSRRKALLGLGGAGVLTVGGVYAARSLAGDSDDDPSLAGTYTSADGESEHLGVPYAGTPIMGSLDAPLRLFYWSDYQCPYCKQFEEGTLPKLARDYVDPGKLAVAFLEFPLFGADSRTAAELSKCAWRTVADEDPNAWGRWHGHVFDQQGGKDSGWASTANLYEYTNGVEGVSASALRTCMREHGDAVADLVDRDTAVAIEDLGLRRATPTFAISKPSSGKWLNVPGAQPYGVFEKALKRVDDA
ncbi:MAG TPA: thioredoxin domain-containing protein [Natrialbaceae archaeon]|nr:thioredoxin domain-containing protein [Natrialbaceae archaeon]